MIRKRKGAVGGFQAKSETGKELVGDEEEMEGMLYVRVQSSHDLYQPSYYGLKRD